MRVIFFVVRAEGKSGAHKATSERGRLLKEARPRARPRPSRVLARALTRTDNYMEAIMDAI